MSEPQAGSRVDQQADYVIVGAGAMGMAFADTLLAETDATMIIVDRHARPGGHWNDSYPFVRLHQPSSFYGVNSTPMGADTIDQVGWNAGLYELASGTEVVTYFDQIMQQKLLPSGRVTYLPRSEFADGKATSLVTGAVTTITATKTVDATYMNVRVPSQTKPNFHVDVDVTCVPLNQLPSMDGAPAGWVIVGAGKTAMDACLWLLSNQVDPDAITWIVPRDSWLLDRSKIQPGAEFEASSLMNFARQTEASATATSIEDLFDKLESRGCLMRIDPEVTPTMYRCATITTAELEQLRRIKNVVRKGRVQRIESERIVLDDGEIATSTEHVHVHCAADGLARRDPKPVFDGDRITLQAVRTCQQVFSAGLIAHIEAAVPDEDDKNKFATPVPHPNSATDWIRTSLGNALNSVNWRMDAALTEWLGNARLDAFSSLRTGAGGSAESQEALAMATEHVFGAIENLTRFVAEADAAEASSGS